MGKSSTIKVERYYSLRVSRLILKTLAVLTVLIAVSALGTISMQAASSPLPDVQDFQMWLPTALSLTIGGGLIAFLFYVLAQILDVQLAQTEKLRQIVEQFGSSHNETLVQEVQRLSILVEQQSRLIRLQTQTSTQQQPTQQPAPHQAKTKTIP